jgi:hypothetical protein
VAGGGAPDPIAPLAAPRPSARCAWQIVEGEAVLLDLDGRRIMGLNPAGSYLWALLDGKRTVAELGAAVAERFQVAAERAAGDVALFLTDLRARGLVDA